MSDRFCQDGADAAALAHAYAAAVDARDLAALRDLFTPTGTLVTTQLDDSRQRYEGHAGLAGVIAALTPFERTLHAIDAVTARGGGERARLTVDCTAHHVRGAVDVVLRIRYDDDCERGGDGRWRFASRRLRVLEQRLEQALGL